MISDLLSDLFHTYFAGTQFFASGLILLWPLIFLFNLLGL